MTNLFLSICLLNQTNIQITIVNPDLTHTYVLQSNTKSPNEDCWIDVCKIKNFSVQPINTSQCFYRIQDLGTSLIK